MKHDSPPAPPLRALLIEDNPADRKRVELLARRHLGPVDWGIAGSLAEGLAALEERWDVVLLDLNLPDSRGIGTMTRLQRRSVRVPVLVLSGEGEEVVSRQAIRAGATDYLPKDVLTGELLSRSIRYAMARAEYEAALTSADERLRQAEKLEAIGQLAGGIAHDFNNVLAIILGNVELALEVDASEVPERLMEIRDAGERAQRLTAQLLAFARKSAVGRPKAVDLVARIEEARGLLTATLGSEIELCSDIPEGPLWVRLEESQLEQVLLNLAVNARDAMPEGGKFEIEVTRCATEEQGACSRLRIRDSGEGIPEDLIAKIFDPFVTSKAPGQGTGLGLATVYGIVRQASGTIEVRNPPGGGAEFEILLPIDEKASRENEKEKPADSVPRALPGETILLVDDEQPLRRLVERILEGLGYWVVSCGEPNLALRYLEDQQRRVDLLITDVVMPEMDGRALATRARQLRPEVCVLLTSGYIPGVKLGSVVGEDWQFLQKPVSRDTLARTVRTVLDASQGGAENEGLPACS